MFNEQSPSLTRFAWLAIAAAVVTIALKTVAWWLTRSVGFLSDAAESIINLVAALVALYALHVAHRPPDEDHPYGHDKAEYFAAGMEGAMILLAAVTICWQAVRRLIWPVELDQIGAGLVVSALSAIVNGVVGSVLVRQGKRHHSITLEADGRHLWTDVWSTVGVIVGVGLVSITGRQWLDPLAALGVAGNIIFAGTTLLRRSIGGLMDGALPAEELRVIDGVLKSHEHAGVHFHRLRTRQAGRRRFIAMDVHVPGSWTVAEGHALLDRLEADIRDVVPHAWVTTHLEPAETADD